MTNEAGVAVHPLSKREEANPRKPTPGPWVFEPSNLFRSGIDGEDWPIGYLSTDTPIRNPIFALHEVIGDRDTDQMLADAQMAGAARDLEEALEWALAELDGRTRYEREGQRENARACADAALAKARGEA